MTSRCLISVVLLLVMLPDCLGGNNELRSLEEALVRLYRRGNGNGKKCYKFNEGYKYEGKEAVTQAGVPCQRWDSQTPHAHNRYTDPTEFKKKMKLENYCRVGDGETGRPWCYTTDPNTMWDYCAVEHCNACKNKKSSCPTEYLASNCEKKWHKDKCPLTCKLCLCPSGFWGKNCDKECTCDLADCDKDQGCSRRCPDGTWGENCDKLCHCANSDEQCDINTGNCKSGCAEGWSEYGCQSECPEGWLKTTNPGERLCYKYVSEPADYHTAKKNCQAMEGNTNLAMPKTEAKNLAMILWRSTYSFWIGLDDWMHEGSFVFNDGSYLGSYSNFKEGEPSNSKEMEHCVIMAGGAWWMDDVCSKERHYLCELDLEPAAECTDTGVVDLDGDVKNCPDYIAQYGNYMCNDSVVTKLCCQTCAMASSQPIEVKYPDKYVLDVLFTLDDVAYQKFKKLQTYPMSDEYCKFLLRQAITEDNVEYMKYYFDLDLNITINIVGIDIPGRNFNQDYEDGDYVRSHGLFRVYADYLWTTDMYRTLRYDVAVLLTGFTFNDGPAQDPGEGGPGGIASAPGTCQNWAISVVKYYGRPQWNYGVSHEVGHQLTLGHMSGGVMYGNEREGHKFEPNQLTQVHQWLDQYWRGDKVEKAMQPGEYPTTSPEDVQKSYIGTNCMRDSKTEPGNPNIDMAASEKTPDQLCQNVFGQNSSFCHYSAFYGDYLPTGDLLCSNLHCIVGAHWECAPMREVELSTEGMVCSINGKTCQSGRCVAAGATSACPSGQFGDFCEKTCHCADDSEACDGVTGVCSSGCHSDFTGDDCQTPVCPADWSPYPATGKCYKVSGKKMYHIVKSECRAQEGKSDIAMAKSPDVEEFIKEIRGDLTSTWIGLDELDTEGVWRWSDGTYAVRENWFRQSRESTYSRHIDAPNNLSGDDWHCCNFGTEVWGTAHCDNWRYGVCELDVARYSERLHPICPNGEQAYVTHERMGQKVTCRDVIKNYGYAACAGDFPVRGMKDVCCETCQGQLTLAAAPANDKCLHEEEGKVYLEGRWIACGDYLDQAPEGNQACRETGFYQLCCQTCASRFSQPFLDVCDYGSVNTVQGGEDLQGKTCSELISERGPGVCALRRGDHGLSQPIKTQCCQECAQVFNPSQEIDTCGHADRADDMCVCEYDDGKVLSGDTLVTCEEYTAANGFTECADGVLSQVCCKTCSQHAKAMKEKCPVNSMGTPMEFSVFINKCYLDMNVNDFATASQFCPFLQSVLPKPTSARETTLYNSLRSQVWIDLKTTSVGDGYQWQWGDGTPLTWHDWIVDIPAVEGDLCAYVTTAGWGQTACSGTHGTICVADPTN